MKEHNSIHLQQPDDLDMLLTSIGDAKYVLLGEASHGTSEFYTWRSEISKKLMTEKGFNFIAVEGDWPSCYELNQYIKGHEHQNRKAADLLEEQFKRWPAWMWANQEVADLMNWLKAYNADRSDQEKIGFYGIDVYSLWESMESIISYLETHRPEELAAAHKAFSCFEPYHRDAQTYGVNAAFFSESCEQEVVELLTRLKKKVHDKETDLSAEMNALVAVNGEAYYRAMVRGGPESWNVRDRHMVKAVKNVAHYYGPDAKVIIWEHNTHIGDARATDMTDEGLVNVGQLLREDLGSNDVYAVGFSTYQGTVLAAKAWGDQVEIMNVPPAEENSWENVFHQAGAYDQLLIFDKEDHKFKKTLGHRAIGVVYDPRFEQYGNYVPTSLSARYDALIYLDETTALHPLTLETLKL